MLPPSVISEPSASVIQMTINTNGTKVAEQRFYPWG